MENELENEIKKKEEELQKLEERKVIPKKVVEESVETEKVGDEVEDEEESGTQEEPKVLEEAEEKTMVDALVNHEERLKNIEATLFRSQ